ncbi:tetratricopeptide repeat protein [Candidatus Fermentibacteria bacterium]|nr:tetratricopeptide repeat protein [Candidatus Fermentibacteria bacterium]
MKLSRMFVLFALVALVACQSRYMTSGKVYMQQSNWEKAQEQFELETQHNPQNGEAYGYLAQAYYELREFGKAGESFERARDAVDAPKKLEQIKLAQHGFAGEHVKRGNALFQNEKFAEAAEEYAIATQIEPGFIDAHKNRAIALLRAGDEDESEQEWKAVLELSQRGDENWVQAHDVFAKLAMQDSAYAEALAHTDSILTVKQADVELLSFKAGLLDAMGREQEALDIYRQILAIDPENVDAWFNLGVIYSKLGMIEEAEDAFVHVVQMVPDDKEAQYNMGVMALNLKRWDMARNAFQKVTELDPENGQAWQNLAICLLNLGDTDGAKAAYEKATTLGVQ